MSEVQEAYHDNHEAGRQQQQHQQQLASTNQQEATTSPKQTGAQKRKRDSLDNGEKDDGREGGVGTTTSRRTSFKQSSPNMPPTTTFMPINPNIPQSANQYTYPSLNVAQQGQGINGSSASQNAANAALAAEAMSGLLPQLGGTQSSMSGYESQSQPKTEAHIQMDASGAFQMSPQPMEGHTEGVGGAHHVAATTPGRSSVSQPASTPNPKPQVGTEEWHRVRRDNHKEGKFCEITRTALTRGGSMC